MTSDALIAMIERKLKAYGLTKVIPEDAVLAQAYREFQRGQQLRQEFEELEKGFKETKIKVPKNLKDQVRKVLSKNADLRWDDAIQIVLDETLDAVRAKKEKAAKKSGDFTDDDGEDMDGQQG